MTSSLAPTLTAKPSFQNHQLTSFSQTPFIPFRQSTYVFQLLPFRRFFLYTKWERHFWTSHYIHTRHWWFWRKWFELDRDFFTLGSFQEFTVAGHQWPMTRKVLTKSKRWYSSRSLTFNESYKRKRFENVRPRYSTQLRTRLHDQNL